MLFIVLDLAGPGLILLFASAVLDRINQVKIMTSIPDGVAPPVGTPLLDAEMPATTRTATFAMG